MTKLVPPFRRSVFALLACGAWLALPSLAHAGLAGQPQPSAQTISQMRAAVAQFEIPGGDVDKARPDLTILIDSDPTQDFTTIVAPALWDDGAYRTIVSTLRDGLDELPAKDPKRTFLNYNMARLHLLRAQYITQASAKLPFLRAADAAVALIPATVRDASLSDLKGDIAAERGDLTGAASSYRRIGPAGGSAAYGQFKIADAYTRGRRYTEAITAYQDAAKTLAGSATPDPQLRHDIYQGLASVYVAQNQPKNALDALSESVKGKEKLTYVRTDTARKLLAQGYGKEIATWADNALRRTSGDDALEALLVDAQKKVQ